MSFYADIPEERSENANRAPENYTEPDNRAPEHYTDPRGQLGGVPLAALPRRLVSAAVDWGPPVLVAGLTVGQSSSEVRTVGQQVNSPLADAGLWFFVVWVVVVIGVMPAFGGQSLGKRLMGMQLARPVVVRGAGLVFAPCGVGRSLIRAFVHLVFMFVAPMFWYVWVAANVVTILATARYQSIGDMATKTVVLAPPQKLKLIPIRGRPARRAI